MAYMQSALYAIVRPPVCLSVIVIGLHTAVTAY